MSYSSGVFQREIYASCITLEDVIKASCLSRIKKNMGINPMGRKTKVTQERIRLLLVNGVKFNWSI